MSKASDYPLYEHWYQTMNWILWAAATACPSIRALPSAGASCNSALIPPELITEAIYSRERQPLLLAVNKNLEKLRLYFRLSKDRQYIAAGQYEYISREINKAGMMCGGWLKNSSQHA